MNLNISGQHVEVTPAIKEYVHTKFARILRHFEHISAAHVYLAVDKTRDKASSQKAEINVHVSGRDLFAEASSHDLYAAIDVVADKLDRQVVRHKDKIQNHHHAQPTMIEEHAA
jgi:putative sigma-54 modulation protein